MIFHVDKFRDLYDIDGCIIEYTQVKVDGEQFKTAATKLSDPVKVKEVVQKMGPGGRANINYVKAFKRISKGRL